MKWQRRADAQVYIELGLVVLQGAVLFWTRVGQKPIYWDDAYIHFRNSLNWVRGEGLLYNPGEWLIGTTSPIYALALALVHSATLIEIPRAATLFNFVCDAGIMLLGLVWLRRAEIPLLFRHSLILVTSAEPLRMYYSSAGMEMSFYTLATMAIFECFHVGRWLAGGLMLGCLGWIRPEGIVVALSLALAMAATGRRRDLGRGFAAAAAVATLLGLAFLYTYGSFVPQSLKIKSVAPWFRSWSQIQGGRSAVEMFVSLARLTPFHALPGFKALWNTPLEKLQNTLAAGAQIFVMALGLIHLWRRRHPYRALSLGSFTLGTYLFYAITRSPFAGWYMVPFHFFTLLLGGIGWWWVLDGVIARAQRAAPRAPRARSALYPALTFALMLPLLLGMSHVARDLTYFERRSLASGLAFRFRSSAPGQYEPLYVKAAEKLNAIIRGDRSVRVGCAEIGVFGYFFNGQILDAYGLVSPEVMEAFPPRAVAEYPGPAFNHTIPVYLHLKPEFILSGRRFLWETPQEFNALYHEVAFPDLDLRFFIRRDLLEKYSGSRENFS